MSQGRDAQLSRADRRSHGVFYTPPEIARLLVREALSPAAASAQPTILDPACGDGALLSEAVDRLNCRAADDVCPLLLATQLYGLDIDAEAVSQARQNIADRLLSEDAKPSLVRRIKNVLNEQIRVLDTLTDSLPQTWPREFDVIVGNPPYVNIRHLTKHGKKYIDSLRARYQTARGAFDLYVLFIERSLELLKADGRCSFIVPNKLATLDYAAPCRHLLVDHTTIDAILDLTDQNIFDSANVYPYVIVFDKAAAPPLHRVRIESSIAVSRAVRQSDLNARDGFSFSDRLSVEQRVATRPLGEICTLHSGTTGFLAQQISSRLIDRPCGNSYSFITSGNIDRYAIRHGDVRFMKAQFAMPQLPMDCELLSEGKRRLFSQEKIVIAGMSRELEAAWDQGGTALGVQVFAAADFCIDAYYLLGLLNSRLLSELFRTRFAAKKLGGGYFSINKGQLSKLPIAIPSQQNAQLADQISELAKHSVAEGPSVARDERLDQMVERLYLVRCDELEDMRSAAKNRGAAA